MIPRVALWRIWATMPRSAQKLVVSLKKNGEKVRANMATTMRRWHDGMENCEGPQPYLSDMPRRTILRSYTYREVARIS